MDFRVAITAAATIAAFQGLAAAISQRVIYTFYSTEKPWNEARDICEDHFGQLIKLETMQQQMEIKHLIPSQQTDRTVWTGGHFDSTSGVLVYQDCLQATSFLTSTAVSGSCVRVDISADINESFVFNLDNCSNRHKFICQRKIGDCWYEPVEDRAGRVQDNTITRGPYQQDATDCALQCRNTNDTGNECWAFTYNITSSECSLHYVNESQVDAPSVTFLENDYNYALQAEAAVLYVRRCFEGEQNEEELSNSNSDPSNEPNSDCSSQDPVPADQLCFCASKEDPPIPAAITLEEKLEELVRELTVEPSNVSAAIRKKTCAEDARPSAAGVGYMGAALLGGVFGSLVVLDATTLFEGIKKAVSLIKGTS